MRVLDEPRSVEILTDVSADDIDQGIAGVPIVVRRIRSVHPDQVVEAMELFAVSHHARE